MLAYNVCLLLTCGVVSGDLMVVVFPQKSPVEIASSQSCEDKFHDAPWTTMKEELEPRASQLLDQFNISSVIRKV